MSQETADNRTVTNYVFNGVLSSGTVNTTPVNFADSSNNVYDNRWVRYGFEGVAEEAIEDGSYINLKSISLSYKLKQKYNSINTLFKEVNISVIAENIFTYTKFKGASPYNTLFDNSTASGLNFFNTPMVSRVGVKITLTI